MKHMLARRRNLAVWLLVAVMQVGLTIAGDTQEARGKLANAAKHWAKMNFKKMRKAAEKARKKDPSLAGSYAYLGLYEYRMGSRDAARVLFETSIERDPAFALPRVYLGNLLFDEGRPLDALDQWRLAARLDYTNSEALAGLALGLYLQNQRRLAIQHYMKAIQWDGRYLDVGFLSDSKRGAAWSERRVQAVRPLLALLPKTAR